MMLAVYFSYMPFIKLKKFSSIPSLLNILFQKRMMGFVKCFFCINCNSYVLPPLHSINAVCYNYFVSVESFLYSINKSYFFMMYILFKMCSWICDIVLQFSLLVILLPHLESVILASQN